MRFITLTTDFLGQDEAVTVPQFESLEEAAERIGADLALDRLNGRLAQDARQTPKGSYRARHDKGEDREALLPEFLDEVEGFMWSASRGGGRDATGLTKKAQAEYGRRVAMFNVEEGRDPTPEELAEIREELGIA